MRELYTVRYKRRGTMPVETGLVEAGSRERAEAGAKGWCERQGYRYVGLVEAVIWRELEEEGRKAPQGEGMGRKAG